MERTDAAGRWESLDDGVTWQLVEPSQAWSDAAEPDPEPEPDPVAELQAQVAELTAALQALIGGD